MSVWSGWESDLLQAANVPNNGSNRGFLDDWHSHATHDCTNNPVDLKRRVTGSTDCVRAPGTTTWQNYSTHTSAGRAFNLELHSGNYAALLAALRSGDPYGVSNPDAVAANLVSWGSSGFSVAYSREVAAAGGSGGGLGSGGGRADVFKGWRDLRRAINRDLPNTLNTAGGIQRRALRIVSRGRKVKL